MTTSEPQEIVLKGGIANAGAVTRVGDTVRRPAASNLETIHRLMTHLRQNGCDFVPEPIGVDDQGREMLAWIPGESAFEPWPDWLADTDLLQSVAEAQQRIHAAAESFEAPPDAEWAPAAGDYFPPGSAGTLVCHNDLSVTNVVVDPARSKVVGVIDWDFSRPVNRLFDIMITARHWVPFAPPSRRVPCLVESDASLRFSQFADAHGLSVDDRRTIIGLAAAFVGQAGGNIERLAAQAGPDSGYQALLDSGYLQTVAETVSWLEAGNISLS